MRKKVETVALVLGCMTLLWLVGDSIIWGQQEPQISEKEAAQVIEAANKAEIDWYKNPDSEAAKIRFNKLVAPGPKYREVKSLVNKAVENGSKCDEASYKLDQVLDVSVSGDFAVVTTKETSKIHWTSGRTWEQGKNPHIYELRRHRKTWKVAQDLFLYTSLLSGTSE